MVAIYQLQWANKQLLLITLGYASIKKWYWPFPNKNKIKVVRKTIMADNCTFITVGGALQFKNMWAFGIKKKKAN